jgi:death on curing protein
MTTKYLALEEILRLHFQIIEDYGGSHGVRDEGRLKSVVGAPAQVVFNKEKYPTIYSKAAVYLRNIIGDHPFSDGNKRTGLTVCAIFLIRNGFEFNADPKTLENFTLSVATEHLSIKDISSWLEEHCQSP